jgi:hypothetical protein
VAKKRDKKVSKGELKRRSRKLHHEHVMDLVGSTGTAVALGLGVVGGSFEGETPYVRLLLIDSKPPQPDTSGAIGSAVGYTLAASAPHLITVAASAQPTAVLARILDGSLTSFTPSRRGTSNVYDVTISANTMVAGTSFNPSYYILTFIVSTAVCELFFNII